MATTGASGVNTPPAPPVGHHIVVDVFRTCPD
jgi:hypothetical protein